MKDFQNSVSILIIDDSPDDREHYMRSLKKITNTKYICTETADGRAGLEALDAKPYDCVLLDYSLPGMNGLEILKKIRLRNLFLPVILLTGQGNEEIAVEAIKEGAHDYLTKSSVNTERLHFTIKAAINQTVLRRSISDINRQMQGKTQELALSEERYELVVRGLSVGIWDWNISGNRLYCSPQFRNIMSFSGEELENPYAKWESCLHPEDRQRTLDMLTNHLKQKEPYDVEYRLLRKDNSYVWIHAMGQAVWDIKGNPIRMVGSVEDISWRKKAEEEREKMIAKLTESNSDLERFAYICSHDLQEPLRMIYSFTKLLEKHLGDSLDEQGVRYMHYITGGAAQARQLINDVLNYARVGHETELLTNIESESILANVLGDLSTSIEETGADITHDALPVVYMQPTHLRQLLQNLIGNALKFCTGAPHIHVGVKEDGMFWCFSVRDNGIGIPQEHMHKIFSIFQRLHERDSYPGTGIGLALCKKIVQKYGGNIWVESESGKGSTFFFTLPSIAMQAREAA